MTHASIKRRSWGRTLLILFAALSLLATACGDDDAAVDDGSATTAGDSGDDGGDGADDGEPRQGGDVVFAATNETASLDPLDHGRASTTSFPMHMFFDSLTEITPEGETVPFLAESVEANEDSTVWTVKLREGVMFHDGTPLDADAVIYSIDRFRNDPETADSQYGIAEIEEMTAVDDLTVSIQLSEPFGAFATALALSPGFPVSPTAVEEMGRDEFAQNGAVGTGPFKLVERQIDLRTVGERNEDYWRDNEPYLDRFVYQPITDAQTRFASIQSGDVDIIQSNVGRQLATAEEDPSLEVATFAGNGGPSVVFNLREEPVDDVRVRQAMAYAINRDVINDVIYDGTMIESCGPFAESSVWNVDTKCYEYDPDMARQLVEEYESETGNEVAIEFLCSTSAGLPEQTELLHSFWTDVGIDVTIDQVEPLSQLERTREDPPQFQTMCWFGDFNTDPDERFRTFYHSDAQGGQRDGYFNDTVDDAFDQARVESDFEERKRLYGIVQEELAEDVPHIYWTIRLDGAIFKPDVHGVEIVPGGGFWPGRVWVEE